MRAINRSAVLDIIRGQGPLSTIQIAAELQLSLPSVSDIMKNLVSEGWVRIVPGNGELSEQKQAMVEFRGMDHSIIGIDLGGTKIYGAVVNFLGEIQYDVYFNHHQTRAEESLQLVHQIIDELMEISSREAITVSGIGIGVPGITVPGTGLVSLAPALGWQEFPLAARLREKYPYPILVENDANLAALGEAWFRSKAGDTQNLVLIAIGTGIGAGVVLDGDIYTGTHNLAGEIGYLLLDRSQLGKHFPDFGAFELIASGTGIANRANALQFEHIPPGFDAPYTAEEVFWAAKNNEPWAEAILADTVDYLALAIAAVTLLYDPEVIVLGGGVSRSADMLIEPVLRRLDGTMPILPKILVSQLGYRGAVLGAAMQLLRITSDHYTIQKFG
jgi:predicted NBD/HSP70 family sugar kinase